jgi:hypothetical protein
MWCHTGLRFLNVVRGMVSTDYKFTKVKSIGSVWEGDHVCYKAGVFAWEHGIVIEVIQSSSFSEIRGVWFTKGTGNVDRTVRVEKYIRDGQLYRYDYDIAVGNDAETTKQRALSEAGQRSSTSYNSGESFGVWCKMSASISPEDASTLAKARMVGRVSTLVQGKDDLQIGDHISCGPALHAIIVERRETMLEVVCFPSDGNESLAVVQKLLDVTEHLEKNKVWKYFYDVNEWKDASDSSEVVFSAKMNVDKIACELPFKDSEHFATWCKTGLRQLHGKVA